MGERADRLMGLRGRIYHTLTCVCERGCVEGAWAVLVG